MKKYSIIILIIVLNACGISLGIYLTDPEPHTLDSDGILISGKKVVEDIKEEFNDQEQINDEVDQNDNVVEKTIKDLEEFSKIIDQDENTEKYSDSIDSGMNDSNQQDEDFPDEQAEQIVAVELQLYAPRVNLQAGESVQLIAYLVYSDNTKQDVSASCSWSISGDNIGTISQTGYLKTVEPGGTSTVYASYNFESDNFIASKKIKVF